MMTVNLQVNLLEHYSIIVAAIKEKSRNPLDCATPTGQRAAFSYIKP